MDHLKCSTISHLMFRLPVLGHVHEHVPGNALEHMFACHMLGLKKNSEKQKLIRIYFVLSFTLYIFLKQPAPSEKRAPFA